MSKYEKKPVEAQLKRGQYNKKEVKFLIDNVHKMSNQQIADALNRGVESVGRQIKTRSLKDAPTKEDQDELERLRQLLKNSTHWPKIKRAVTKSEMRTFEDDWINVLRQLGEDVWFTEEMHIVDWLLLDVKKYRTLSLEKNALESLEKVQEYLDAQYSLPTEKRDMEGILKCEMELPMHRAAITEHTASLKTILEKIEKISDKLKANREERRDIKATDQTFWGFVQMLDDQKFRKEESRKAQLMKAAANVAREEMYEYHEFADDTVDVYLLNPESALRMRDEEREKESNRQDIKKEQEDA